MPYGLSLTTYRLVRVADVPNGLRCGAVCPGCRQPLVARNRGVVRQHHFAHHNSESSCESWLHATAKQILFERENDSIRYRKPITIRWQCSSCSCSHHGNLLKKTARVVLEQYLGDAEIKPDLVAYDKCGQVVNFQEVVFKHKPELHTHQYAESKGIPLVVFNVSDETDLESLQRGGLKPDIHYAGCSCEKRKCDNCRQLPCDDGHNPLPHKLCDAGPIVHCRSTDSRACYCSTCSICVDAPRSHRHCSCGNVIDGPYSQCFCCFVGCQDRVRTHRHCKGCRKVIYKRDISTELLYERCYECEQKYRARAAQSSSLASGPTLERCAECRIGCQFECYLS